MRQEVKLTLDSDVPDASEGSIFSVFGCSQDVISLYSDELNSAPAHLLLLPWATAFDQSQMQVSKKQKHLQVIKNNQSEYKRAMIPKKDELN